MDKSELNVLFDRKLEELKERDSAQGRVLEAEVATWAGIVPAAPGESTWDLLYRQIRCRAEAHKILEEQAIHNLFDPGSTQCFMILQVG